MYLINVCIVITALCILSSNAFPDITSYDDDDGDISREISINLPIKERRDVFDPYGFNSILTRFVKRNKVYQYPIKRTKDSIYQNEDDFIY